MIPVRFEPREPPLAPVALAARGEAAYRLGRLLLERGVEGLWGCAGVELLLIGGPAERLSWVEGGVYLGREPSAPELYLPTALAPSVPPSLLWRALRQPGDRSLAFLPPQGTLPPLSFPVLLQPVHLASLQQWMERA